MIHCIGDSHVSIFNGLNTISEGGHYPYEKDCLSNFHTYNIGPCLAYNFKDNHWGSSIKCIIQNIPKIDYLLFSAGQIDCYSHLPKQKILQQNRTYDDIIKECVNIYFNYILMIKNMGYHVLFYGPIVSSTVEGLHDCAEDKMYAVILFTDILNNLCKENNIPHIKMYDKLIDKYGIKEEFYIDGLHLNNKLLPVLLDELHFMGIL